MHQCLAPGEVHSLDHWSSDRSVWLYVRGAQKVDCDLPVDHQGSAGRPQDMPTNKKKIHIIKILKIVSLHIKKGLSTPFVAF